jgi:hypothetical protein
MVVLEETQRHVRSDESVQSIDESCQQRLDSSRQDRGGMRVGTLSYRRDVEARMPGRPQVVKNGIPALYPSKSSLEEGSVAVLAERASQIR